MRKKFYDDDNTWESKNNSSIKKREDSPFLGNGLMVVCPNKNNGISGKYGFDSELEIQNNVTNTFDERDAP